MNTFRLKQLAKQIGLVATLDRLGARGAVVDGLTLLVDSKAREKKRLIDEDYLAFRTQYQRLVPTQSEFPNGIALMISSMPTVWGLKLEGAFSLAIRSAGYRPVILQLSPDVWSRRYHAVFGNYDFVEFHRIAASQPPIAPAKEFLEFRHISPTVRDLMKLTYRQVDIGRIAVSNLLYRHKFEKFDLAQPHLAKEIYDELLSIQRNVHAAERMIEQTSPAIALVLEKGLSPSAEVYGVCVARGIPVIQYSGSQDKSGLILRRFLFDNRHQHPFSLDASSWTRVKTRPWNGKHSEQILRYFNESYVSGTWFNRKYLSQGKRIKSADEVRQQLGIDPSKKTAVIFSHVLWDATFFYGQGLFDDYETWLLETVRAACANPKVNWLVKLHPDLVWKLKYEGYAGELRDIIAVRSAVGSLPDHVKFILPDTDISTYSFFDITDYCLTVRGTIGIEMACHGVPVLTAGTGRYSHLGFTIDSDTIGEYLERIAHINRLPSMTTQQIELAQRFAYALFNLRPWKLQTFELTQLPVDRVGHPLDTNVAFHVHSFDEFTAQPDICRFVDWMTSSTPDYVDW